MIIIIFFLIVIISICLFLFFHIKKNRNRKSIVRDYFDKEKFRIEYEIGTDSIVLIFNGESEGFCREIQYVNEIKIYGKIFRYNMEDLMNERLSSIESGKIRVFKNGFEISQ